MNYNSTFKVRTNKNFDNFDGYRDYLLAKSRRRSKLRKRQRILRERKIKIAKFFAKAFLSILFVGLFIPYNLTKVTGVRMDQRGPKYAAVHNAPMGYYGHAQLSILNNDDTTKLKFTKIDIIYHKSLTSKLLHLPFYTYDYDRSESADN